MIYFDNAATSYPKPLAILEGMKDYITNVGVNPLRGVSHIHEKADQLVQSTRQSLADLFHINTPNHLSFTHNATHGLNVAIKGLLKPEDHVIMTDIEHNSVIRPLRTLEEGICVQIDIIKSNSNGEVQINALESLIKPNTKLIVMSHASNVTGLISPITKVGQIAKKHNIIFLVDCTQTAGIINIDVEESNIDILVGTGHKSLLGPSGIGFLYIKNYSIIKTLFEGGGGYDSLMPTHPDQMPDKYEAGTINYLGIAGLKKSLDYISSNKEKFYQSEINLTKILTDFLSNIPRAQIFGIANMENKVPIVTFNLEGLYPCQFAKILDQEEKIIVRSGLHCAPLIHETLGTLPLGAIRVSFGHQNTQAELGQFTQKITQLLEKY